MSESLQFQQHPADAVLWQWHAQELETAESAAVRQHLQGCADCRLRAQTLNRLVREMRAWHESAQPSLGEQIHLVRALEAQFAKREQPFALARTCRSVVRWLAPAIAVLAAVFVLWREETAVEKQSLESLLSQTREEQLLMTSNNEDLQQTLLELAFSTEEK